MTGVDIVTGLVAGLVSCLTPEALLLLPLLLAAVAATRSGIVVQVFGLGLAMVVTGLFAGSFATVFGLDAVWARRFLAALLLLEAIALMSPALTDRLPALTGGATTLSRTRPAPVSGTTFRLLLLALFVGAIWSPMPGPTLGRASMMAADADDPWVAFGILFLFGVGAALPWLVAGRLLSIVIRPMLPAVVHGTAGKGILGLVLLLVALAALSGQDAMAAHWLNGRLPVWMARLGTAY